MTLLAPEHTIWHSIYGPQRGHPLLYFRHSVLYCVSPIVFCIPALAQEPGLFSCLTTHRPFHFMGYLVYNELMCFMISCGNFFFNFGPRNCNSPKLWLLLCMDQSPKDGPTFLPLWTCLLKRQEASFPFACQVWLFWSNLYGQGTPTICFWCQEKDPHCWVSCCIINGWQLPLTCGHFAQLEWGKVGMRPANGVLPLCPNVSWLGELMKARMRQFVSKCSQL